MKKSFYIEDQVNNCFRFLGQQRKDAHEMNEQELLEAESELAKEFCWIEYPDYIQSVPKHISSGTIIEANHQKARNEGKAE